MNYDINILMTSQKSKMTVHIPYSSLHNVPKLEHKVQQPANNQMVSTFKMGYSSPHIQKVEGGLHDSY
jgi:hypothetical protein